MKPISATLGKASIFGRFIERLFGLDLLRSPWPKGEQILDLGVRLGCIAFVVTIASLRIILILLLLYLGAALLHP